MKALKLLVTILVMNLLAFVVNAGKGGQVPESLRKQILTQYPDAQDINGKLIEADKYEVDFVWGEHEYVAYYHNDGSWIGTTRHVDEKELPEIVQALVQKVAPNTTEHFCLESNSSDLGEEYLVYYKQNGKDYELLVNAKKFTYEVKQL
ncbi:MAG: hypothetical protein U0U66_10585 [Cytophagaceae bacterium]